MDFNHQLENKIARCEVTIAYVFIRKILCAEALNNAGDVNALFANNGAIRRLPKNDRLAVYGDIVAAQSLCRPWYSSGLGKGAWTSIRNEALGNIPLAQTGFSHDLDMCVTANSGTVEISEKMMATAVEAILGAVHLDGGDDALAGVMRHLGIVDPSHESVHFVNASKSRFTGAVTSRCEFEVIA